MAALVSLTANYTDSEDEDGEEKEPFVGEEPKKAKERPPSVAERMKEKSTSGTPGSGSNPPLARLTPTKKMRLVSYMEEGEEEKKEDSDDDIVDLELDSDNASLDEEDQDVAEEEVKENEEGEEPCRQWRLSESIHAEVWTGGVKLTPEPPGMCDPKLQQQINDLYRQKRDHGYDMNAIIQNKKAFRNPSIYEKLIHFCDIDETGTNFPKELYDGHLFGKESSYDELAKVQAADTEHREKAAKKRQHETGIVLASGLPKQHHNDPAYPSAPSSSLSSSKPRRSKWGQGPPMLAAVATLLPPSNRPPTNPNLPLPNIPTLQMVSASVLAPQVVSATTRPGQQAAKTISAFGPLKR